MAKIIMPDPKDLVIDPVGDVSLSFEEDGNRPANVIMAASQGAQTGVKLAVAVGAMVLAFVALVALAFSLALASCTVGPGFDFADFVLLADLAPEAARLRAGFPGLAELL